MMRSVSQYIAANTITVHDDEYIINYVFKVNLLGIIVYCWGRKIYIYTTCQQLNR